MNSRVFSADTVREADVVIVGGGVAGMTAALHARGRRVVMVSKTSFAEGGSSSHAQGGIAAAVGVDDSPADHAEDTLRAGAGLCDIDTVRRVTTEGRQRIAELSAWGARFDLEADGSLALAREGAHHRHRVAHASGDSIGAELMKALASAVREAPQIETVNHRLVLDLIRDRGAVVGVMTVDRQGRQEILAAPEVVLATGGVGRLWIRTTNPAEATGDGLAMAYRAGAALADLEFVQFHPTALDVSRDRLPLLTEALRGEGAVLVDGTGRRFMIDVHEDAELAPRDVVAAAIFRLLQRGGRVFLDATGIGAGVEGRFPTVATLCRENGFDLGLDAIPVTPAAHYHMGGVAVDAIGRTTVPGLWACGEVARTGLHGANRLASNSLLEAAVYGAAVGDALAAACRKPAHPVRIRNAVSAADLRVDAHPWLDAAPHDVRTMERRLRRLMWDRVGLERDATALRRAASELGEIAEAHRCGRSELANMVQVMGLVLRAASTRTESRGAHRRTDFPRSSRCWRQPLVFENGDLVAPRPVATATKTG